MAGTSSHRIRFVRVLEVASFPSTIVFATLVDGSGVSIVFTIQIISRTSIIREVFELPRVLYFAAVFRLLGSGMYHASFLRVAAKVA